MFFLLLIWTIVLCLSIELGTRVILRTANYLYKPFFERQNSKVYRMVKFTEDFKSLPTKESFVSKKPTANNPKQNNEQPIPTDSYICNKDYELTLQGVAEIKFDKKGNLIESHGDPIFERNFHKHLQGIFYGYTDMEWNNILSIIKTSPEKPIELKLKYMDIFTHLYEVQIIPGKEDVSLIAQESRNGYPLSLRQILGPEKENSPWLVYNLIYKPFQKAPDPAPNTNNLGFRDDDVILPKPSNLLRIVCIGGSTTEEGNDTYSTYPNIMERKLKKYFSTENIDVINAGICGGRSFGEVRRIDDFLSMQPDLLVYYNAINDICYHYIPFWLALPNPYKKYLKHSAFLNRMFNRKLLPSDEYIADYLQKTILRNLGAMNCACKKRGVQMAICSFAYPKLKWFNFIGRLYCDFNIQNAWLYIVDDEITYNTYLHVINIYNCELKKFCEKEGIIYIPVAEEFNAQLNHFCDVCHMTPLGLDVKTDIIGSHIARWIENKNIFPRKAEPNN